MKNNATLATVFIVIASFTIFSSCCQIKTGDKLSNSEINYLKELGILNDNETVILFESHAGEKNSFKISGNYFTDRRIAAYWIDNKDTGNTTINYAFYEDIDTITTNDLTSEWDLASYLTVKKKDRQKFNVFIGCEKKGTLTFFNQAINEWTKHK